MTAIANLAAAIRHLAAVNNCSKPPRVILVFDAIDDAARFKAAIYSELEAGSRFDTKLNDINKTTVGGIRMFIQAEV